MKAKLVKSCDADNQGIPLDLESLLSPYRHHKQLSIRIEQLPQLARLSKGRNNGDCTFSLKPDELPSLVYLPPAGSDGSPVTLAVRIVNLDDDYATTLALIDLLVPREAVSVASTKRKLRVVETPGEIQGEASDQPAEPAALQAIHVKRPAETGAEIDPARAEVQTELEDKLSQLREQLEATTNYAEAAHKQVLQAAEAALARDFVDQVAATKEKLEQEFTDRLAEALRQSEEEAEARVTAAEERAGKAETDADRARADAQKDFDKELSQLRQQLEAATSDTDAAHKQAKKDTEADRVRDIAEQIAAAKEELEQGFADRLAETLGAAEEKVEARVAAAKKETEEAVNTAHAREIAELQGTHARAIEVQDAATKEQLKQEFTERLAEISSQAEEKIEAQAVAAETKAGEAESDANRGHAEAKKTFEDERAQLRQQHDTATIDIEEGHKQAIEAVKTAGAAEIAALQSTHASALEDQAATTKEQIAATEARLEQESADRLADALRQAEIKSEAALSTARETWQDEEAARLAAAKQEFEAELSQLRQQLDSDTVDVAAAGKQALKAAETKYTHEIAEQQSAHASALEEQVAATKMQLEQEFTERLAEALRQAEEKADTRLTDARQTWESDAETALSAARDSWKAEESERLAAAKKEFENELSTLQKQLDTEGVDIDEIRKQAIEATEAAHAAEIAELKSTHARALEKQTDADEKPQAPAVTDSVAEALRQAEEKTEARLTKARRVWEADAEAKFSAARETWKAEEAERLAAAKLAWQGGPQKGPTARERAYRAQRNWMPRRSRIVAAVIAGLLGLPLLHPDVRSLVTDNSALAIAELRGHVDFLLGSEPSVTELDAFRFPQPAPADIPVVAIADRAIISVGSANVRAGPSPGAIVIKSLPRGSEVTLLGSEKGWQRIRFGERSDDVGWVFGDLLSDPPIGERTP